MATLQDIATEVGVSVNTVSRVLNGNHKPVYPRVAARAENIRQTAARMGYRPNTAAQSTRTGRFNCMALISPLSMAGFLPPTLLVGLDLAMRERNLHLSLSDIPKRLAENPDHAPKLLREMLVDGLLINYSAVRDVSMTQGLMDRFETDRVPTIWLNTDRDANCILPDDEHGGAWAAELLIQRGVKRPLMLNLPEPGSHVSVAGRERGFVKTIRDAGLTPQVLRRDASPTDPHASMAELVDMFRGENRPDGVFAYENEQAGQALMAATAAGLHVPNDLKLVATSSRTNEQAGLPIATLQVPFGEVGEQAVGMLAERIDNPRVALPARRVPYLRAEFGVTLGSALH